MNLEVDSAPEPERKRTKAKTERQSHCVYDLCSGKTRRRFDDYTKTQSFDGDTAALSPDFYLLANYQCLQTYPFEEHQDLPETVLVDTIHWYISQRMRELGREDIAEQFDGTALLGIALHIEELIKETLGENGHLLYAQSSSN